MSVLKIIVIIIIIIAKSDLFTYGKIIWKEFDERKWYSPYLEEILKDQIDSKQLTLCVDFTEICNYLPSIVPSIKVNTEDGAFQTYKNTKIGAYVLDLSKNSKKVLHNIQSLSGWNPRAKFFILFNNRGIQKLLQELFKKYIINVVIFQPRNNETIDVFTYYPFKSGELRPKTLEAFLLTTLKKEESCDTKINPFPPDNFPKKWKNTVIKVAPVNVSPYMMCPTCSLLRGLEFHLLTAIGKRLNISFKYPDFVFETWGFKTLNGTYEYALAALEKGKFNMVAGAFRLYLPECFDFDFTYPHMEDNVVFVVPSAKILPRWKSILRIFQVEIWTLIFIIQMVVPLVFYMFSFLNSKRESSIPTLKFLSIMLKIPIARMYGLRAQKGLLIIWMLYCFLVDTYFESHFQGALNMAHRDKQINNLEELEAIEAKVGINENVLNLFDGNTKLDQFVHKNKFHVDTMEEAIDKISNDNKTAAVLLQRFVQFYINRKFIDNFDGSPKLHIVDKQIQFLLLNMYYRKGFPLLDLFEDLFWKLKSTGYIHYLYSYASHKNMMKIYGKHVTLHSHSLSLSELKYLFWFLLAGLFCAGLVFIFELVHGKNLNFNTTNK